MSSYYEHTKNESANVPYSFQCEHCGKNSGTLWAVITGSTATENSNFKTLSPKKEERLYKTAHENLVRDMQNIHKNAVEKKVFSKEFRDECPYCRQPQSWAVALMKKDMFTNPIVCLIIGIIVALGCMAYCYMEGDTGPFMFTIAIRVFALGAAVGIICLIWNVIKLAAKTKKTSSSAVRNLPVIDWSPVQELLDTPLGKRRNS